MIESSANFSELEDKFPGRWNNHHMRKTEHSTSTPLFFFIIMPFL